MIGLCSKNQPQIEHAKSYSDLRIVRKSEDNTIEHMAKLYTIKDQVLGVGSFGKVLLAESTTDPSLKFAVKIVSKEQLGTNISHFREVYRSLKSLDNPSILKYYEIYENEINFYLVMEYFEGQQLLDKIVCNVNTDLGCVDEQTARIIMN